MGRGYVYFLKSSANGFIKIGWTGGHPDYRLESLRSVSPTPLEPIAVMRGYRDLERKLHTLFVLSRHHGEWFQPTEDLTEFIRLNGRPWPDAGEPPASPEVAEAEYQAVLSDLVEWALAMRYIRGKGRPLDLMWPHPVKFHIPDEVWEG